MPDDNPITEEALNGGVAAIRQDIRSLAVIQQDTRDRVIAVEGTSRANTDHLTALRDESAGHGKTLKEHGEVLASRMAVERAVKWAVGVLLAAASLGVAVAALL